MCEPRLVESIKQGSFREYYERMYGQRKVLKEVRA